jgi:hypothetical protein
MSNSTFSSNGASVGGGLINSINSTATVTNSTFSGNNAVVGGGGFFNNGMMTLRNTLLVVNTDH